SDLNGLSSTGLDNTKTRRPQPRSNKKNDRVSSVSKSSRSKSKEAKVEEHHREGENDMWVWGQGHMGRSGEGLGTVQVRCGCTGMAGEEVVDFGGKGLLVTVGLVIVRVIISITTKIIWNPRRR
nr:hypothetical protein [Tanacetum cinerariifolium]